jgi:hypothetical protein
VVLVALLGPVAPATAATTPCVGVVVDGRLTGGTLRTACAKGDPQSGLEALTRAGIGYAFVPRQPGQVCQLDGVPACSDTGADTYWSYWWRAKGSNRWVYATTGAGSHDPEPGDTEAWVWQDGGKVEPPDISYARICPQAAAPHRTRTATATATSRPSSSGEDRPVPGATTSKAGGAVRTHSPKPSAAASSSTPEPSTTSSTPTPSPVTASSSPAAATAATGPDDGDGSPPWAGLAIGAVLVGGLGGAALLRGRRSAS